MKRPLACLGLLLVASQAFCNGSERGGGGDGHDITFRAMAASIVEQLSESAFYQNLLGEDLTRLRAAIRDTPVDFTTKELSVNLETPSTGLAMRLGRSAKFHLDPRGRCTLIEVNLKRWDSHSLIEKRRLALHEYLGCIERESTSDYSISATIYSRSPLMPSLPVEFGLRAYSVSNSGSELSETQLVTRQLIGRLEGQIVKTHSSLRVELGRALQERTWTRLGLETLSLQSIVSSASSLLGSLTKDDSMMTEVLRLKLGARLMQAAFLSEQVQKLAILSGAALTSSSSASEKEELELYASETMTRLSQDLKLLHQRIDGSPAGTVSPQILSDIFDLDLWDAFGREGGLDHLGWGPRIREIR